MEVDRGNERNGQMQALNPWSVQSSMLTKSNLKMKKVVIYPRMQDSYYSVSITLIQKWNHHS